MNPDPTAAAQQAAAHFARQRSGPLSESSRTEFNAWLNAAPENAAAWREHERLWTLLESVRAHPRILTMREDAGRWSKRFTMQKLGGYSAAAALALAIAGSVWWAATMLRDQAMNVKQVFSTGIGQHSDFVLVDGSRLTLDTATTVRVDYSRRLRHVTLLNGRAFFEVAKNAARPFVVAAGSSQVLATGTAFDVRMRSSGIQVTLLEGAVNVATGSTPAAPAAQPAVHLRPGMRLTTQLDGSARVEQVDAGQITSWRKGVLVFDAQPLGEAIVDLNRYWQQQIVISDPALARRPVTAVFDASTSAASVAQALQDDGLAQISKSTPEAIYLAGPREDR